MANTCNCPHPPGGSVVCSDNQLAVCGYRDGKIVSGCFDRPSHIIHLANEAQAHLALTNWVLSMITGEPRAQEQFVEEHERRILAKGLYEDLATETTIKFTVPSDYNPTLQALSAPLFRTR